MPPSNRLSRQSLSGYFFGKNAFITKRNINYSVAKNDEMFRKTREKKTFNKTYYKLFNSSSFLCTKKKKTDLTLRNPT